MDLDYDAIFGIAEGGESGENGQEVAEPAEPESEGGNGQEVAEPAEEAAPETAEAAGEGNEPADQPAEEEPAEREEQSREERARFAAQRRRAEREAELERAKAEARSAAREEMNELIRSLGIRDPGDAGRRIESVEDLERYRRDSEARRVTAGLQDGNLRQEDLAAMVARHVAESEPVKRLEQLARAEEARQRAARAEEDRRLVAEQLQQIHAMDESISTVDDLLRMENAGLFSDYVSRGLDFVDAFILANRGRLAERQRAAAQQQARNAQGAKGHLTPPAARGAGAAPVPPEELAIYRALNPGISDSEIQKHYNKFVKERK